MPRVSRSAHGPTPNLAQPLCRALRGLLRRAHRAARIDVGPIERRQYQASEQANAVEVPSRSYEGRLPCLATRVPRHTQEPVTPQFLLTENQKSGTSTRIDHELSDYGRQREKTRRYRNRLVIEVWVGTRADTMHRSFERETRHSNRINMSTFGNVMNSAIQSCPMSF